MSKFRKAVDSLPGSRHILEGNIAFALGVVHAGYHAADGYPGTPSTEVIDKGLAFVQDRLKVGWSVNEAVAVGVGIGHAIAGFDTVVTMKIPGVFQGGDVISTSAFYTAEAGALVLYVATDFVPSSTQHVIDPRHFFASCRLPVLEPRTHQEMYDIAFTAADISRDFKTPVVVLASGILAHSEALITTRQPRSITPRPLGDNLHPWMLMPGIARTNYDIATRERIPAIRHWAENSNLFTITRGTDKPGIITCGEAGIIVQEALEAAQLNPSLLSLAIAYPLPVEPIRHFARSIDGPLFIFEEGNRFIQEQLQLAGINLVGKQEDDTLTTWTPVDVLALLGRYIDIGKTLEYQTLPISIEPVKRPPTICPGCPYRAFALVVDKLKKKKKLYASFGDIGCSTLLYFLNAIDTVCCMGASDSLRQGFVLSRPDMAHRTISVIGDSCECHSGLDATRNAVFRHTPGVKVILDNRITAMTGGQPAPSSEVNLENIPNPFVLKEAEAAEKARTVVLNSYHLKEVEKGLTQALAQAETGEFSALILEGPCIHQVKTEKKARELDIDREKCRQCGLCGICPGIQHDENRRPEFTILCSNCGSNMQVCQQVCPFNAIVPMNEKMTASTTLLPPIPDEIETIDTVSSDIPRLPASLRVAIRGIGGQGNLFFGKVLSEVALRTPYSSTHIVKGDTHGMAQLGGAVISVFSCGQVHSPQLAPHSADVLVALEIGEILRPGFLNLLKQGGTIILNNFQALPPTAKKEQYPSVDKIRSSLTNYRVISIDAYQLAQKNGDKAGKTANVSVLGLLSTIEPFIHIPEKTWIAALNSLSNNMNTNAANVRAFKAGRNLEY